MNRELLISIITLFESFDKTDQLTLNLLKLLTHRLASTENAFNTTLGILHLPESDERTEMLTRMRDITNPEREDLATVMRETAKIIAHQETIHEKVEATLAGIRTMLEAGRPPGNGGE